MQLLSSLWLVTLFVDYSILTSRALVFVLIPDYLFLHSLHLVVLFLMTIPILLSMFSITLFLVSTISHLHSCCNSLCLLQILLLARGVPFVPHFPSRRYFCLFQLYCPQQSRPWSLCVGVSLSSILLYVAVKFSCIHLVPTFIISSSLLVVSSIFSSIAVNFSSIYSCRFLEVLSILSCTFCCICYITCCSAYMLNPSCSDNFILFFTVWLF